MKLLNTFLSFLFIALMVFLSFYVLTPKSNEEQFVPAGEFSVDRAMTPLIEITKKPHYLTSEAHAEVQKFLLAELNKLGLEPHIQEGYNFNSRSKVLTKPTNIIAKIPGTENGKALVLLSHYDSAATASLGAADDASGIATILESLRAFLSTGKHPKNDIIILFTDSEEISLDGAQLFVKEHPWIQNVGLVINFEARGTKGPSNMILETNQGNKKLIKAFSKANPKYPVASSLMYSVYKLLPNDTDSTIFREFSDIDSFFFAFIDGHYNYHTAKDTHYNLDRNSLMHQGSYLVPLLHYFADANLTELKSEKDHVYFNFPIFKLVHYPFSWVFPMVILVVLLFSLLLLFGFYKDRLHRKFILKGFGSLFGALLTAVLLAFFGWKLILAMYPEYREIQQGFTYNGHQYIAFFVVLALAVSFFFYRRTYDKAEIPSLYVAPLTLWLILNLGIAFYLKGAAFFIIPVFFGLFSFYHILNKKRPNLLVLSGFSLPAVFIFAPLIQFFPVGLGLKMLLISAGCTVLLFTLMLPIFATYQNKKILSILCILGSGFFFIKAHMQSKFTEVYPKPNSLIYFQDSDNDNAYWATYDFTLDSWTKEYLGDDPEDASEYFEESSYNKYGRSYTYAAKTKMENIPKSEVTLQKDTFEDGDRELIFTIVPQRKVNKIELYPLQEVSFEVTEFNGITAEKTLEETYRGTSNSAMINFYVSKNDSLHVRLRTKASEPLRFKILEYSFDLMETLEISARPENTMPKPFILTDAIVIKHEFSTDIPKIKARDFLIIQN